MKKSILFLQVLVMVVFFGKIAFLGELWQKADAANGAPQAEKQVPVDPPPSGVNLADKDLPPDSPAKVKDLLKLLETRKIELDKREEFLKSQEERLLVLKNEIVEKIDLLQQQEEKLKESGDARGAEEKKKYKDLAKVLEATPPAKAGVMLERMDIKTAAGITINMKRDKAGAIWGYLSPQKAVEITREITGQAKP